MTGPATVTGIIVSAQPGALGVGAFATFQLTLSQALTVSGGTPTLLLNDAGTATYTSGSGTNTLSFTYQVQPGQNTTDLRITGMALNGATIGNGVSGYGAPVTYAVGTQAQGLVLADLNHDGVPDIAVATTAGVAVLLADGHGGFGPATIIAGLAATGIAATDINGDGATDLLVDTTSGTEVLSGDGHGGFVLAPTGLGPGTSTGAIAVGPPLPNAARPDVVIGGLSFIGDSRFSPSTGYRGFPILIAPGLTASGVAAADLNGDGQIDLIAAVNNPPGAPGIGGVVVALDPGPGLPNTVVTYAAGSNPVAVAVADVNHDGTLDIIVADRDGAVAVLLGGGAGTFTFATTYAAGVQPSAIAVADVTGDGIPDIIVSDSQGGIEVLRGDGHGGFGAPTVYAAGIAATGVAVADVTGDGVPDIVATTAAGVMVLPGMAPSGPLLDPGSVATAPGADTGRAVYTRTSITAITSSIHAGPLAIGQTLVFTVITSDVVLVSGGAPSLLLSNGASAAYTGGSGTTTLTFSYTVQPGQSAADLMVTGLATGGAMIGAPGTTPSCRPSPMRRGRWRQ